MGSKTEMEMVADGAGWIVKKINSETGKVSDAETYHASKPADDRAIGGMLTQEVRIKDTRRDIWQSMLGRVFQNARLDGYKGTGHTGQAKPGQTAVGGDGIGKISKELKNAVQDAETAYLRELVEQKHIKIKVEKDQNAEHAFQSFVSDVRSDKNYSNLKTTVIRFFHFCGRLPITESGYLIPVPVMQAQLAETMVRKESDNSVRAKLKAIVEQMDKGTIDADDAIDSLAIAKNLVLTLEGITNYYAELATAKRAGPAGHSMGDVAQQGEAAIKAIMQETEIV